MVCPLLVMVCPLLVRLGRGAVRRSESLRFPIASCLQGSILAPTAARLPTACSVAHGHWTFWLSAAAATGRGAKCAHVAKIASTTMNTALAQARIHETYATGGPSHGDHGGHGRPRR
jgi:hypothetical protein